MKKFLCLVGLLLALIQPCFCASVVIENYTPEEFKKALTKIFIKGGADITNVSDYSITVIEKGSFLQNVFGGSQMNSYVANKEVFNFTKDNNNVIVNANFYQITNPGSAFEIATPMNERIVMQNLELLKKGLNGFYGYGFDYNKIVRCIVINQVHPNTYNLKKGDKIIEINGKPVSQLTNEQIKEEFKCNDDKTTVRIKLKLPKKQTEERILESRFIEPIITKENL